jgi:CBS domain-containing protein
MTNSTRPAQTAADVMTPAPRTCSAYSSVLEATMIFRDADCGAVPIVDGDRPIGILTDRDVALAVSEYPDLESRPVTDVMTKGTISVLPEASLADVQATFAAQGLHRLLVVDSAGRLQGIIAWGDLAPHLPGGSSEHIVTQVAE